MGSTLEIIKGWSTDQIAAMFYKIAGQGNTEEREALLRAVLRDEYNIQLIERILKLGGKNGRIIPRGIKAAVCDANKNFHLVQPSLDYAARLVRFQEAFKVGPVMSAVDFEARSKKLIAEIKDNKSLCNLLNGICLPIILPQLADFVDYGKTLEEIFLPAVRLAYEAEFPGRKFHNYREDNLVGKVSVVPESRHDRLIAKMKKGLVVALYFPAPMQGFSVRASREQIAALPESLILAGGFDVLSGLAMYSDVLARNFHVPGYDLSALTWPSPGFSLYLLADDDELDFDDRGCLGDADGGYSSGLVCLGSA